MKIKTKRNVFCAILLVIVLWAFWPYIQVGVLTMKYGENFEEGYKQSEYFKEESYLKPRVLRYRNQKAGILTDSGLVKLMLKDEREDIAVVSYGSSMVMVFRYNGKEWVLDTLNSGGENFIMLQSATTDNLIWPFYLW